MKPLMTLALLVLIACSTTKTTNQSKDLIGNFQFDRDSVTILTPFIQIGESTSMTTSNDDPESR